MMTLNQLKMFNLAPRGVKACCVPTSLCFVTGASYQDVDHLIESSQASYRRGKGVYTNEFLGAENNIFGFKITRVFHAEVLSAARRVYQIQQMFPTGTYLICIRRHMFVMKDSEFFDLCRTNLNDMVLGVWEVRSK